LGKNQRKSTQTSLPEDSIYQPAKELVEKMTRGEYFNNSGMPAQQWANLVVHDLLADSSLSRIRRGNQAEIVRDLTPCSSNILEGRMKEITGFDLVEQMLRKRDNQYGTYISKTEGG
jgi:hypothetical protein